MSHLLVWIYRHAGRLAWVVGGLALLALLWMLWDLSPLQPTVLALQLSFDAQAFLAIWRDWGPEGQLRYLAHFDLDHLFIVLYGMFGALVAASRLCRGWPSLGRWLFGLALPVAAVADLVENALHLYLLRAAPLDLPALAQAWVPTAASASLIKWALIAAFVLAWLHRLWAKLGPIYLPRLELKLPPVALMALAAVLIAWTRWRPVWPPATHEAVRLTAVGIAAVLAAIGLALVAGGVQAFRQAHTTLNPLRPTTAQAMVTEGVYRFSRNPMYAGMALLLLAMAVALRQPLALLVVLGFVAYLDRFQIRPEEAALEARFGPAFRLYAAQVRRWL